MTNKESEDAKRANYFRRIGETRVRWNLPHLTADQTHQLIERLMRVPGSVTDLDLRVCVRLFCREMCCRPTGPIYE